MSTADWCYSLASSPYLSGTHTIIAETWDQVSSTGLRYGMQSLCQGIVFEKIVATLYLNLWRCLDLFGNNVTYGLSRWCRTSSPT